MVDDDAQTSSHSLGVQRHEWAQGKFWNVLAQQIVTVLRVQVVLLHQRKIAAAERAPYSIVGLE
jgi:hypothetical protein